MIVEISICLVERMTVNAVGFKPVMGDLKPRVFGVREWFQMIRIDTRRCVTTVMEIEAFCDRAVEMFVNDPVC
jgi:hypothetical protein